MPRIKHKLKETTSEESHLYDVSKCGKVGVEIAFLWRNVTCKKCLKHRKSKWSKLYLQLKNKGLKNASNTKKY